MVCCYLGVEFGGFSGWNAGLFRFVVVGVGV